MTEHTQECLAKQAELQAKIDEYTAKYPNHCKSCGGLGRQDWYESVPYGMGSASMPMSDICGCVANCKCPRCGEEVWNPDELDGQPLVCLKCGWNENNPDVIPDMDCLMPCLCVIEEEKKWEEDARNYLDELYYGNNGCTCEVLSIMGGEMLAYNKDCPISEHAAKAQSTNEESK